MERTKPAKKEKPANAILTADLHLSDTAPVSRTDDYIAAQSNKLSFLQALSIKNNNCPILCAGDIFHQWKASPWLCSWVYYNLPGPMYAVPGNHDLPMHQLKYYDKSALNLIEEIREDLHIMKNNTITTKDRLSITGIAFGELDNLEITKIEKEKTDYFKILILHQLVWKDKKPIWGKSDDWSASELLRKYGKYFDLILTGDNHESFVVEDKNSILVNPGSMMRITVDQADLEPKCYLYYTGLNKVTAVNFPIEKGVHNRDHIDKIKERDERIAAYIERMSQDWEIGLSFKNNLQTFFVENKVSKKVRETIWEHLESETT